MTTARDFLNSVRASLIEARTAAESAPVDGDLDTEKFVREAIGHIDDAISELDSARGLIDEAGSQL